MSRPSRRRAALSAVCTDVVTTVMDIAGAVHEMLPPRRVTGRALPNRTTRAAPP